MFQFACICDKKNDTFNKVAHIGEYKLIVISKPGINTHFALQLRVRNLSVQHIHQEQRDALLPRAYLQGKHDNNSVANARQTLR